MRHAYLYIITSFCSFFAWSQQTEQVTIIGSGPAGLTAAIYTSRAGLSTLVLEGEPSQVTFSHAIENFPGFPQGINGVQLSENMREQAMRFGTQIQSDQVTQVDLSKRPFQIVLDNGKSIYTDALIIASGASAKWLGLQTEKPFIGNGVSSCATCDGFFFKGKEVVVIGGGDTALEDALFLAHYASKVTVIHRRDTLKASPYLQKKAFANSKIHFLWNSVVEEMTNPEEGILKGVVVRNVDSQQTRLYPCQGVFVAIGHVPNTELFKDQLPLTSAGYIVTQPFSTHTAIPGVFAAGDVADSHYRQAITAAGTGCMAGIDAYHFIQQTQAEAL